MHYAHHISAQELSSILTTVRQAVSEHFAHWQASAFSPDEFEAAIDAIAVDLAGASIDRLALDLRMMRLFGQLNNGHSRWLDSSLVERPPLGLNVRFVGDQWLVTETQLPDVRIGDAVREIDGRSIDDWWTEMRVYTKGSPQACREQFGVDTYLFPSLLHLLAPTRFRLTWENAKGQRQTMGVDRQELPTRERDWMPHARWLTPSVAYLRVPSLMRPEFQATALQSLREFADAACLLLDVRGNSGGSTAWDLTPSLMNGPYHWWLEAGPSDLAPRVTRGICPGPQEGGYAGELLVLTDAGTWSAAEDLIMPLRADSRAVFVGETTGGSTGQPYLHTFDNGLRFSAGSIRVAMPDGADFEGEGIAPDVAVVTTREDLYAGRDPVLSAAREQARQFLD